MRVNWQVFKSTLCLGFLISCSALAEELPEPFVPVKANGVGGAFTAVANDESSVWTNPGGISRIHKARARNTVHLISIPNFSGGYNTQGKVFFDNIQIAQAHDGGTMASAVSSALQKIDDTSKPIWAIMELNPIVFMDMGSRMNAAVGPYMRTQVSLAPDATSSDMQKVDMISDFGANLAWSVSRASNRVNFGMQLRPIMRYDYNERVDVPTLVSATQLKARISEQSNSTRALAVDVGAIFTLADFWFPTVGFAIFNLPTGCQDNYLNPYTRTRQKICGAQFTGTINNPDSLGLMDPTDIRVGVSITPRLFHRFSLRFSADLHHLSLQSGTQYYGLPGVDIAKQIHGGIELFTGNPLLPPPLSFQLGMNQGFFSGGFSLRLGFMTLQLAAYGRDVSAEKKPKEDRRTMLNFSLEF